MAKHQLCQAGDNTRCAASIDESLRVAAERALKHGLFKQTADEIGQALGPIGPVETRSQRRIGVDDGVDGGTLPGNHGDRNGGRAKGARFVQRDAARDHTGGDVGKRVGESTRRDDPAAPRGHAWQRSTGEASGETHVHVRHSTDQRRGDTSAGSLDVNPAAERDEHARPPVSSAGQPPKALIPKHRERRTGDASGADLRS